MNKAKTKGDILAERIAATITAAERTTAMNMAEWLQNHLDEYHKPEWTLGRSVNGFTLSDGEEWHRQDWTKDMLPDGWRPLLLGEQDAKEDEYCRDRSNYFEILGDLAGSIMLGERQFNRRRTRRPLPEVKKPVPLGPEDVKCGDLLSSDPENYQVMITHKGPHSVSCPDCGMDKVWRFQELKNSNMKISRDGGNTWKACSK